MDDGDALKTFKDMMDRGFDRMEGRFDGLTAEIRAQSTAITVLETNWTRHLTDADKRDKRISALYRSVGETEREVSQVGKAPSATTIPELIKVLDEREAARSKRDLETEATRIENANKLDDARAKRMRNWIAIGSTALLTLLAVPSVRGCLGEAQTKRLEASVEELKNKPAQKVTVLPAGPPTIVIVKPDAEVP